MNLTNIRRKNKFLKITNEMITIAWPYPNNVIDTKHWNFAVNWFSFMCRKQQTVGEFYGSLGLAWDLHGNCHWCKQIKTDPFTGVHLIKWVDSPLKFFNPKLKIIIILILSPKIFLTIHLCTTPYNNKNVMDRCWFQVESQRRIFYQRPKSYFLFCYRLHLIKNGLDVDLTS